MDAIEKIKDKLKKHPTVSYKVEGSTITVELIDKQGFPVTLSVNQHEYTVCFGNWHGHFETEDEGLNYFAFGLSDSCRLRESSRGEHPYKWVVEYQEKGDWKFDNQTGLLCFHFWHKKEEKIYQNNIKTGI